MREKRKRPLRSRRAAKRRLRCCALTVIRLCRRDIQIALYNAFSKCLVMASAVRVRARTILVMARAFLVIAHAILGVSLGILQSALAYLSFLRSPLARASPRASSQKRSPWCRTFELFPSARASCAFLPAFSRQLGLCAIYVTIVRVDDERTAKRPRYE
eukprot:461822-Pleurochrysis_carterae.AAC.3